MRSITFCLCLLIAADTSAQSTRPGRYGVPAKAQGLKLTDVWGYPEIQPDGVPAVFSHDGKLALAASGGLADENGATEDGILSLWDVSSGRLLREVRFAKQAVSAMALTPDGQHALLGLFQNDGKGKEIRPLVLWDLKADREVFRVGADRGAVAAAVIHPDGKQALISRVSFENKASGAELIELSSGKSLARVDTDANHQCFSLAFVPGKTQAVLGHGAEIAVWDLTDAKGKPARTFPGLQDMITQVQVSADGRRVVAASLDYSVHLWDLATGKEIAALKKDPVNQGFVSTALLEGDKVLCVWTGLDALTGTQEQCQLSLWDAAAKKEVWSRPGSIRGLTPIHIAEGGKQAVLGGGANPFLRIRLSDGSEESAWGGHKSSVNALLALDKTTVVSAGQDGILKFWEKGEPKKSLRAHGDAINALALSADGQFLVTASADKSLKLWDVKSGALRKTFLGHTGNVTSVAFGPDMSWIVSGSNDRTVKIWDVVSAKEIQSLTGHSEGINAVALSPDASWLASGSDDNTVRLWPLKNGKQDADRDTVVLEDHKRQVTALAFLPGGKQLVSASQDKTIKLWDVPRGKVAKTLSGHGNWISSLTLLDGGKTVASTSDDLTVRLWDLAKGTEVGQLDLSVHSDCPRYVAPLGDTGFIVGTSGWVILQCTK